MLAFVYQHADSLAKASEEAKSVESLGFDLSNIGTMGIVTSILGYVIVFAALVFLFLAFTWITKLVRINIRKKLEEKGELDSAKKGEDLDIAGDISAAIGMALYLHYEEVHDWENTVLTIERIQKPYRPWSSKIYGLREFPRRRN